MILALGILYILIFEGLSLIRREGLSTQFAFEVLGITAIVKAIALTTNTVVNPIFYLA